MPGKHFPVALTVVAKSGAKFEKMKVEKTY